MHGAQLMMRLIFATSDDIPKAQFYHKVGFLLSFSYLFHQISYFLLTAATRAHAATASPQQEQSCIAVACGSWPLADLWLALLQLSVM